MGNLYKHDVNEVIILCGVLANMSVNEEARQLLVEDGIFKSILQCMQLEPHNIVLQIACIKALVNYSTNAEHYMLMEELQIPNQIGLIMVQMQVCRSMGTCSLGNTLAAQFFEAVTNFLEFHLLLTTLKGVGPCILKLKI